MMNENNKAAGNAFEAYIAKLYQNLGYDIELNLDMIGQQVDIFASKYMDGIGHITIIIECKYLTNGNISNQVAQEFATTISALRLKCDFSFGVMITNKDFSTGAKHMASNLVHFRTQLEIENELLNPSPYYYRRCKGVCFVTQALKNPSKIGFNERGLLCIGELWIVYMPRFGGHGKWVKRIMMHA